MIKWKIIKDFPDYMISNLGNVKRIKNAQHTKKGYILKNRVDKKGYLYIGIYRDGKQFFKKIHRLILENFNPIEGMDQLESNHKNGIKSDNRYPENLEWSTHSENQKHAYDIGLKFGMKKEKHPMFGRYHSIKTKNKMSQSLKGLFSGEKNSQSKLNEKDIYNIRLLLKEDNLTQNEIAKKFDVHQTTISKIKNKQRWKYIKEKI